jgi:predicted butyrate kinase (DUF1464 family)
MVRVAGVDPGTVSFDLCVLEDGEARLERSFRTGQLARQRGRLIDTLLGYGPYQLVYGPSGYGLPLLAAEQVGERELAQMVLVRPDEAHAATGIGGLRSLLRELVHSGLPVVFGPGVIHLATVPGHRKYNRIDLGTADKVCAAACAIEQQASRHGIEPGQAAMIMLELGGAFTAALAIADGRIVDGMGGSSGPIGARAPGALDGELAYLLGAQLSKRTLFSGGALDPAGRGLPDDPERLWRSGACSEGWRALLEAAAKAVRALTVSVPAPREVILSGRLASITGVAGQLTRLLGDIAPVVAPVPGRCSAAARGAALLADGLAGGRHAALVEALCLREASGSVLDHIRVKGAERITLG